MTRDNVTVVESVGEGFGSFLGSVSFTDAPEDKAWLIYRNGELVGAVNSKDAAERTAERMRNPDPESDAKLKKMFGTVTFASPAKYRKPVEAPTE